MAALELELGQSRGRRRTPSHHSLQKVSFRVNLGILVHYGVIISTSGLQVGLNIPECNSFDFVHADLLLLRLSIPAENFELSFTFILAHNVAGS